MIKISYDKEGDILEIKFSDAAIADSEYINESSLVVDYDGTGKLVAVEVISFSKQVRDHSEIEKIAI